MYDALIYGYGLSIDTLFAIKKRFNTHKRIDYILFNDFIYQLIHAKEHSVIRRRFDNLFNLHEKDHIANREIVFESLRLNYQLITEIGFERWVSKNLFQYDNDKLKIDGVFAYLIYNYWYSTIEQELLNDAKIIDFIDKRTSLLHSLIDGGNKIFTTNFDMLHDRVLNPKHLHGTFIKKLNGFQDIVYKFLDPNEFEYRFLLGTNGYEKLNRISRVEGEKDSPFYGQFFLDQEMTIDHLLIYGLSFGWTEFITEEILEIDADHKNNYLMLSVDGHIIMRLEGLYQKQKINKITLSYFSDNDLMNYERVFEGTKVKNIIEFKHCSEIINFI